MQGSDALLGGLGVVAVVFLIVLAVLAILMPFMVYAAQKWAHRSYQELAKLNKSLGQFLETAQRGGAGSGR